MIETKNMDEANVMNSKNAMNSKNGTDMVLVVRGEERLRCKLQWQERESRQYWVGLDGPAGFAEGTGNDLFDALAAVRRRLEKEGWLIAVQGARRDAFPSGMLRDMAGGGRVYILEPGRPVSREHLASTFADADPAALGTVDEQFRNYHDWRATLTAS